MDYNKTCFHVIINRCSDNLLVARLTFKQALARRALENWHQRGEAEAPPDWLFVVEFSPLVFREIVQVWKSL